MQFGVIDTNLLLNRYIFMNVLCLNFTTDNKL